MKKLQTIQRENKLNDVFAIGNYGLTGLAVNMQSTVTGHAKSSSTETVFKKPKPRL